MRYFYPSINVDNINSEKYCQLEAELIWLSKKDIIPIKLNG